MSRGQQLTMPARSPLTAEVCEQLVHLLGALVFDRADAVAASVQFFGDGCPDAGVVREDKPGRADRGALVLVAHLVVGSDPLNFEQALVDTLGRHSRRGAQRLHREAVEDSQRSSRRRR